MNSIECTAPDFSLAGVAIVASNLFDTSMDVAVADGNLIKRYRNCIKATAASTDSVDATRTAFLKMTFMILLLIQ